MEAQNRRYRVIDQIVVSDAIDTRKGITYVVQLVKCGDEQAVIRLAIYSTRTGPDGQKQTVYSPWPATFPPEMAARVSDAIAELVERYKGYLEIAESEKKEPWKIETKGFYDKYSAHPKENPSGKHMDKGPNQDTHKRN